MSFSAWRSGATDSDWALHLATLEAFYSPFSCGNPTFCLPCLALPCLTCLVTGKGANDNRNYAVRIGALEFGIVDVIGTVSSLAPCLICQIWYLFVSVYACTSMITCIGMDGDGDGDDAMKL
jgi:hypothetical protein